MGDGAGGMVTRDQGSEGDRERVNQAVGDPAVGIGVADGQAGSLFDVLME